MKKYINIMKKYALLNLWIALSLASSVKSQQDLTGYVIESVQKRAESLIKLLAPALKESKPSAALGIASLIVLASSSATLILGLVVLLLVFLPQLTFKWIVTVTILVVIFALTLVLVVVATLRIIDESLRTERQIGIARHLKETLIGIAKDLKEVIIGIAKDLKEVIIRIAKDLKEVIDKNDLGVVLIFILILILILQIGVIFRRR